MSRAGLGACASTGSARAGFGNDQITKPAQAELVEAHALPVPHGKLTANAPLAPLVWFKSGGTAEWLFEPKDVADLQAFLRDLDPAVPPDLNQTSGASGAFGVSLPWGTGSARASTGSA